MSAILEANQLLDFINTSPSTFHVISNLKTKLNALGFTELDEQKPWKTTPGYKYFVERNDSSLMAFVCGKLPPSQAGFRISTAHTDSPCLKIKPGGELVKEGMAAIRVETYGGAILSTWLDRELSLAGKMVILKEGKPEEVLINIASPIAIIPNLAIHLNREVNKGFEINPHTHLTALLGNASDSKTTFPLKKMLAQKAACDPTAILDFDLVLHDAQPGQICGLEKELIAAARLDNLASCYSMLRALENMANTVQNHTVAALFFDHEEVGSLSSEGADSSFASDILERISLGYNESREEMKIALAKSFAISCDGAHAVHPNFADKHDDLYAPRLNQGIVIKKHANQRYATNSSTASEFLNLCSELDIKPQWVISRPDMPCGSTVGPVVSATLGVRTIDIGCPMWAMHSIRETMGIQDVLTLNKILAHFFTRNNS